MVACRSHPVTCGRTVHKLVDNPSYVRITVRILWISCGLRKGQKKIGRTSCGGARRGRRKYLTAGNGHHSEETLGVGDAGKPDSSAGGWRWRAARSAG